jgi:hypothetical protein
MSSITVLETVINRTKDNPDGSINSKTRPCSLASSMSIPKSSY